MKKLESGNKMAREITMYGILETEKAAYKSLIRQGRASSKTHFRASQFGRRADGTGETDTSIDVDKALSVYVGVLD